MTQKPVSKCPVCGKPKTSGHAPFCSARCATIDLARWLTGSYRVPSDEMPEDEGAPGEETEE